MKYVSIVDVIWYFSDDKQLSQMARDIIADETNEILLNNRLRLQNLI